MSMSDDFGVHWESNAIDHDYSTVSNGITVLFVAPQSANDLVEILNNYQSRCDNNWESSMGEDL